MATFSILKCVVFQPIFGVILPKTVKQIMNRDNSLVFPLSGI